jgi:hypothetical protein
VLTVEVGNDDVEWDQLTIAQEMAEQGRFARATSGFIAHLADHYERHQDEFARLKQDYVRKARTDGFGSHRRTPGQIADLAAAWHMYLDFAVAVGAINADVRREYLHQVSTALGRQATEQGHRVIEVDPVERFLDGVSSLLSTGRAHLVAMDDEDYPNGRIDPAWGGDQGERLGYVTDNGIFLDSSVSLAAVEKLLTSAGEPLGTTERSLRKGLADAGHLVTTGNKEGRQSRSVRRVFAGHRGSFLHLQRDAVRGAEPDQPDHTEGPRGRSAGRQAHR